MSDQPERDPLESALAGLQPAPASLDRDCLMFAAGQASVSAKSRWLWPTTSAALLCLSLGLGAALAARPAPTETVRIVYIAPESKDVPQAAPAAVPDRTLVPGPSQDARVADMPALGGDYLRLRHQVLRFGVESLPESPPLTSPGKTLSINSRIEPAKKES